MQRILTTHVGSLPTLNVEPAAAVDAVVRKQRELGLDLLDYRWQEKSVYAIAEAMRVEYEAIAAAGATLQVDDAWLPAALGPHRPRDGPRRIQEILV
jgi:methionine synthase II (cobalamin-independent)